MSNYHVGGIDSSIVNNNSDRANTNYTLYDKTYNPVDYNQGILGVDNLSDINNFNLENYLKQTNVNNLNKTKDNNINIESVENHLKYEKYNYYIDMQNNINPNLDKTFDDVAVKLTNAAETGVKVFDSFLTSLSPKVENVLNSVMQEQTRSQTQSSCDLNNQKQQYFIKEIDSKIFIVCEIPRVEKANCRIKLDSNNILNINAKTLPYPDNDDMSKFNFIEQREYSFEIKLSKEINSKMIVAKIVDGVLYIEISKKLINIEEINIL